MALSEDDKRRIEEEEYRKHVQSQLRSTQRLDLNLRGDQRIETHGVGREMYRDAKAAARVAAESAAEAAEAVAEELRRATRVRTGNVLKLVAIIVLFLAVIGGLVGILVWLRS